MKSSNGRRNKTKRSRRKAQFSPERKRTLTGAEQEGLWLTARRTRGRPGNGANKKEVGTDTRRRAG